MKISETGRSMVEMLGVLAIMGVLTVGVMLGYRYAMDRILTNSIITGVRARSVIIGQQRVLGQPLNLSEFHPDTEKDLIYGRFEVKAFNNYMYENEESQAMEVHNIPRRVCENIRMLTFPDETITLVNGSDMGECLPDGPRGADTGLTNAQGFLDGEYHNVVTFIFAGLGEACSVNQDCQEGLCCVSLEEGGRGCSWCEDPTDCDQCQEWNGTTCVNKAEGARCLWTPARDGCCTAGVCGACPDKCDGNTCNRLCQTCNSATGECVNHTDGTGCGVCKRCENGACVPDLTLPGCEPKCTTDDDCDKENCETCDTTTGKCIQNEKKTVTDCNGNSRTCCPLTDETQCSGYQPSCPNCQLCDSATGKCQAVPDGNMCGDCKECQNGQCVDAGTTIITKCDGTTEACCSWNGTHTCEDETGCCFTDDDCQFCEQCTGGRCVPNDDKGMCPLEGTGGCAMCQGGKCVPRPTKPRKLCNGKIDDCCLYYDNSCEDETGCCTTDDDCDKEKCETCDTDTGKCIQNEKQTVTNCDGTTRICCPARDETCKDETDCCETDDDCKICQFCDSATGKCQAVQDNTVCGDCKVCQKGECVRGDACCGACGICEECQDGTCVTICQSTEQCLAGIGCVECVGDLDCKDYSKPHCELSTHTCVAECPAGHHLVDNYSGDLKWAGTMCCPETSWVAAEGGCCGSKERATLNYPYGAMSWSALRQQRTTVCCYNPCNAGGLRAIDGVCAPSPCISDTSVEMPSENSTIAGQCTAMEWYHGNYVSHYGWCPNNCSYDAVKKDGRWLCKCSGSVSDGYKEPGDCHFRSAY